MNLRTLTGLLVLTFGLQGCLPYGCSRVESRALVAADSVSRARATTIPVDTLQVEPSLKIPGLEYPRTALFQGDGTLWVSDAGTGSLIRVAPGDSAQVLPLKGFPYPYLIGETRGSVWVFSPTLAEIAPVAADSVGDRTVLPFDPPAEALTYAAVSDSTVWVKLVGKDIESRLLELTLGGEERRRWTLSQPWWRWAGFLRVWQGRPVSLSGYRPNIYRFGESVDTLRLSGFDSPMLARSRAFMLGEVDAPPLLSASAAPAGDLLFVLNMRPGWLRIDVFDAAGNIVYALVEPRPAFDTEFFPTDLAVRRADDGSYDIVVTIVKPGPAIRRYRWVPVDR